jgi:hypothetical protein
MTQNAILVRENMQKKKPANPACSLCDQVETCNHLLLACVTARMWGIIGCIFYNLDYLAPP